MTTTTADKGEQECREAFERELLKKYPSAKNIKRADGTYIGHVQLLWEFWQVASSKNIVATKVLEDIKMALSPAPYNASYVEFAKECRQTWNRRPTNEGQDGLTEDEIWKIAEQTLNSRTIKASTGYDIHFFARGIACHLSSHPTPDDQQAKDAALVDALRSAEDWIEGVPHGDNCWLHGRHENVPNNGCYCGKDAVIAIIDAALSTTKQEEV